jgi:hypothetical protein
VITGNEAEKLLRFTLYALYFYLFELIESNRDYITDAGILPEFCELSQKRGGQGGKILR